MSDDSLILCENNRRIFVSLAALNEDYILDTIKDAYAKASNPELIYFGIFNQKFPGRDFEDFSEFPRVRVINATYEQPLGTGLARVNTYMLHAGEQYFCQIDAHNFFVSDWDKLLREDYEELKELFGKRVILSQSVVLHRRSAYENQEARENLKSWSVYPLTVDENGFAGADMSRGKEPRILGKYLEHYTMNAGAEMFTESHFIYDIPHDYTVLHYPEQELTALRACTRGYRIFSRGKSTMSTLSKISEDLSGFDSMNYPDSVQNLTMKENIVEGPVKLRRTVDHLSFLSGVRFGHFGAPDKESYERYISLSGYKFPRSDPRSHVKESGNINDTNA